MFLHLSNTYHTSHSLVCADKQGGFPHIQVLRDGFSCFTPTQNHSPTTPSLSTPPKTYTIHLAWSIQQNLHIENLLRWSHSDEFDTFFPLVDLLLRSSINPQTIYSPLLHWKNVMGLFSLSFFYFSARIVGWKWKISSTAGYLSKENDWSSRAIIVLVATIFVRQLIELKCSQTTLHTSASCSSAQNLQCTSIMHYSVIWP